MANAAPLFGEEALRAVRRDARPCRRGASALAAARRRRLPRWHPTSTGIGSIRRCAWCAKTALPTTSTTKPPASCGRGNSTSRRSSSAPTIGRRSRRPSRSAHASPTRSCTTSTATSGCCATVSCPPHLVLGHPQYLRALQGVTAARRRARPLVFGRSGARERRFVDRARQPRRCTDRLGIRTRKPDRRQPNVPGTFRRARRAALGDVLPALSVMRSSASPAARAVMRCCSHRAPTTRPTSSTPISRAILGLELGRRRRPLRPRRDRLPANAGRPRARLGHLPPARLGFRRSARTARRFGARRARPRRRHSLGQRRRGERARRRRRRIAGARRVPAERLARVVRRGIARPRHSDRVVRHGVGSRRGPGARPARHHSQRFRRGAAVFARLVGATGQRSERRGSPSVRRRHRATRARRSSFRTSSRSASHRRSSAVRLRRVRCRCACLPHGRRAATS